MRNLIALLFLAAVCLAGSQAAHACTGEHERPQVSGAVVDQVPLFEFEASSTPVRIVQHDACDVSCAGGCGCGCSCVGATAALAVTKNIDHPPLKNSAPPAAVPLAEPPGLAVDLAGPPKSFV